jgi:hypothetical protein
MACRGVVPATKGAWVTANRRVADLAARLRCQATRHIRATHLALGRRSSRGGRHSIASVHDLAGASDGVSRVDEALLSTNRGRTGAVERSASADHGRK